MGGDGDESGELGLEGGEGWKRGVKEVVMGRFEYFLGERDVDVGDEMVEEWVDEEGEGRGEVEAEGAAS